VAKRPAWVFYGWSAAKTVAWLLLSPEETGLLTAATGVTLKLLFGPAAGTKLKTLTDLTASATVVVGPPPLPPTAGLLPAAVSMPKLPFQLPKTLMKSMPSQLLKLKLLVLILSKLRLEVALPLVALPAVVLSLTRALPEAELSLTLLLIPLLVVELISVLLPPLESIAELGPLVLMPPPRAAALLPVGALTIMPTHLPMTFTKTSRASLPTTCLPVRLRTVRLVEVLPVVALPAVVLLVTSAVPVWAVKFKVLLIELLSVKVAVKLLPPLVFIGLLGPVVLRPLAPAASKVLRASGGSK